MRPLNFQKLNSRDLRLLSCLLQFSISSDIYLRSLDCVKSVRIRSYSVRIWEKTDQTNSQYGYFSGSVSPRENWYITTKFMPEIQFRSSHSEVFLEISPNSPENTCTRVFFFNKVAGVRPATLFKKRIWHRCCHVNFTKFLRTPFLTEHLLWLLLSIE